MDQAQPTESLEDDFCWLVSEILMSAQEPFVFVTAAAVHGMNNGTTFV